MCADRDQPNNNETEAEDEDSDVMSETTDLSYASWVSSWRDLFPCKWYYVRRSVELGIDCDSIIFSQHANSSWKKWFCFGQLRDVDEAPTVWLENMSRHVKRFERENPFILIYTFFCYFSLPDENIEYPLLLVAPVHFRDEGFEICEDLCQNDLNDNEMILYISEQALNSFVSQV